MKIGFFTDDYLPRASGIAYSIESFRVQLEAMGHEVYVFAPKPTLRFKEPSKNIIRFPAIKGLFYDDYMTSLFFPPQVARKIEKLKLDVIHFHTPSQVGLMGAHFALRHDIPLVTTYHTDLFEYVKHYPQVLPGTIALSMIIPAIMSGGMAEFRSGLTSIKPERSVDKWNQKLVERSITMIHNHCDVVITPSRKVDRQLKSWKTQSKLTVLPTGVDPLPVRDRDLGAMRKLIRLEPTDRVALFVGRTGHEKNISLLIDAFEQVVAHDPHAKLVIAGTGDDLPAFRAQAAALNAHDRIVFAGLVDHDKLGALYALANVFVFPSIADTQGLVVNEAAQAGLPIVMLDRDITEVVKANENGYFPRRNAKDLAAKINDVLSHPRRQEHFGARSVELASRYTVAEQAAKLVAVYDDAIIIHRERSARTKPKARMLLRAPWQT